jgi:SAM-dependent methyltransferase
MENLPDNFIDIPFSDDNLDRYIIRTSIKRSLDEYLKFFRGKLLDAGCGKMPYRNYIQNNSHIKEYVGLDLDVAINYDENIKPDFSWDGIAMPFQDNEFDTCIATEVLEHCPEPEVFLKEVYRVLKPDGVFFFTVPFLWNLHEVPHDEYRYTPFSLERHFKKSGFSKIEIKATGGWHASMAQMIGLWVKRSHLDNRKRKWAIKLAKPVMKKLLQMEGNTKVRLKEGQMITGLYGILKK